MVDCTAITRAGVGDSCAGAPPTSHADRNRIKRIDIVLAVDVSGSMEALDFKLGGRSISRVEVVKSVVANFIEARPSDRIAMIVFAARPYLISPLTLDHDWLLQNLERVHIGLVEDGTAIGSGIVASVNRLRNQPSKSKIIILLTDGMNNAGKVLPETAADAARALDIKVYTILAGVRGNAPMPITDQFGNRRVVMAKVDVDETTLKKVAKSPGRKFYRQPTRIHCGTSTRKSIDLKRPPSSLKKFEQYQELFDSAKCRILILGLETPAQTRFRRLP